MIIKKELFMKNKIKSFMFVLPAIIISFVYLLMPTSADTPVIFLLIISLWVLTFSAVKNLDYLGRLIVLMILSIPVSFISINGSITKQGYLNWFNLFSLLLFIFMVIRVLQNLNNVHLTTNFDAFVCC